MEKIIQALFGLDHGVGHPSNSCPRWKQGVRDLVMEICCALHNFQVRLTPWQPMVSSG